MPFIAALAGLGRSPGEGNGYPLQYSGLEDSMDCTVHGVTKSQTRLSDFHFFRHVFTLKYSFYSIKSYMADKHSKDLACMKLN